MILQAQNQAFKNNTKLPRRKGSRQLQYCNNGQLYALGQPLNLRLETPLLIAEDFDLLIGVGSKYVPTLPSGDW
jgi:hypothetical protein